MLPAESNLPSPASLPKVDTMSLPDLIVELNKLEHAALNISKLQPLPLHSQTNLHEAKELVLQAAQISPVSGNAVYLFFCKNRITNSSIAAVKHYLAYPKEDKQEQTTKPTKVTDQYEDAIKRVAASLKDAETEFILKCQTLDPETLADCVDTPIEKVLVFLDAIKETSPELAVATETVSYKQSRGEFFDTLSLDRGEAVALIVAGTFIADVLKQLYSKDLLQCPALIQSKEQPETPQVDVRKISSQSEYLDKLAMPVPSRCIAGEKLAQEIHGQCNYQTLKREQLEQYATEVIDRAGPSLHIPGFLRPRIYVDEQSGIPTGFGEEIGMMIGMRKQEGRLIPQEGTAQGIVKFEYFVARGDELYCEFPLYKPDCKNLEEFLEKTYQRSLLYYQRMFEYVLPKEKHISAYSEGVTENIRNGKIFSDSPWLSPSLRNKFADFVEKNLPEACTDEFVKSLEEYFSDSKPSPTDAKVNQIRPKLFDLILDEHGVSSPHIGASVKVDILLRKFLDFIKKGASIASEKEEELSSTFQEAARIEDNEALQDFACQCVKNNGAVSELTQKLTSGLDLANSFGIALSDERLLLCAFHPTTAEVTRFTHLHMTKILENEIAKISADDPGSSLLSQLKDKLYYHEIRIGFYKDGSDFLNAYYLFKAYPNSKDAAQELVSKGKQLLALLPEANPLNRVVNEQVNKAMILLDTKS